MTEQLPLVKFFSPSLPIAQHKNFFAKFTVISWQVPMFTMYNGSDLVQ
jgi:hypothetical protein